MARCNRCGKKGLFLKLIGGLCDDCQYELRVAAIKKTQPVSKPKPVPVNATPVKHNPVDLAEQVMNSLMHGGAVSQPYQKEVKQIKERFGKQAAIAAHAAELCGEPNTAKGYFVKSIASEWAGASYRKEVIKWTHLWIESGMTYKGIDNWKYPKCTPMQSRAYDAYHRLGKAYEGEYMFEEALTCYKKAMQARPDACNLLIAISKIYTKMNQIDDAIDLLEKTPLCAGELSTVRTSYIQELKEKKAKGYVYKPRLKRPNM